MLCEVTCDEPESGSVRRKTKARSAKFQNILPGKRLNLICQWRIKISYAANQIFFENLLPNIALMLVVPTSVEWHAWQPGQAPGDKMYFIFMVAMEVMLADDDGEGTGIHPLTGRTTIQRTGRTEFRGSRRCHNFSEFRSSGPESTSQTLRVATVTSSKWRPAMWTIHVYFDVTGKFI